MKRFLLLALFIFVTASNALGEKLTIWHTENDPATLAALDAIGKRFTTEHPGYEVEFLSVGWDDLYKKLAVAMRTRSAPVLTQIEPFMAAALHQSGQLQPLDDVIGSLNPDDMYPAVRDLQLYDGKRYGVSTALGISYYSFRHDKMRPGAEIPKTWDQYRQFAATAGSDPAAAPLLLPANDLHIVLLFSELVASNGGRLFTADGKPNFLDPRVQESLDYWRALYNQVPATLRNSSYKDNFGHYAAGRAFTLPCFFGRGIIAVERAAAPETRNPEAFDFFPHIAGPSGATPKATLDAEAWVILKDSPNPAMAKEFLRFFYRKDNYLQFCNSVPIHLTPIYKSLAQNEYAQTTFVRKWHKYYDYQLNMLDSGNVLPIFMTSTDDRFLPLLFQLEGSRVVSNMVRDVTFNNMSSHAAAEKAIRSADAYFKAATPPAPTPVQTQNRFVWLLIAGVVALIVVVFAARRLLR